ncbi:MAG TPA: hypothetical protein VMT97_00430 [Terriglobales bacterium]|nr:hypothetical protein [Candidatus Nitrosotalea sp.]HUO62136.1 hypothetical protein [Terriglobales bacterium]
MDHRAAALTCLLLVGVAAAASGDWLLWEELVPANAPLRMEVVGRFPSAEACQARAMRLSDAPARDPGARLGYVCLPAAPPSPPTL